MSAKSVVGNRVKRSTGNALDSLVSPRRTNPPDDFARRSSREGQQKNSFGRNFTFEKELDSRTQRGGLARPRSREHAKGAVAEGGRLTLAIIQMLL
jgi:hypothetical protein